MKTKFIGGVLIAGAVAIYAGGAPGAWAQETVVRIMTTETNDATKAALDEIIGEYESAHDGVEIVAQYVGFQDLSTKLMASFAAGDPPEIFNVQSNYQAFVLAEKGLIQPVDHIIDAIGREDYEQTVLDASSFDGKMWVVPFSIGVNVLWYRSDLYEQNGLASPDTWEIFEENNRILNEKGAEGGTRDFYGLAMTVAENWLTNDNTQNWMWTNGAEIFNANREVTLASPESVDTFEYLKRLTQYAPPAISSYTNMEMLNAYATGAVAHTEYPFRLLAYLQENNPDLLEVTVPVVHPKGPAPTGKHATFLYVKGWAMAKDAANADAAADFLEYLETGDREIRMLKTVPVHYWPPRKSVQNDPEFLDQPLLKSAAGQRSVSVLKQAISNGNTPLNGSGTTILELGPILADRVLAKALQQIVINNSDAKAVLEEAAPALQQ